MKKFIFGTSFFNGKGCVFVVYAETYLSAEAKALSKAKKIGSDISTSVTKLWSMPKNTNLKMHYSPDQL